jgi:hypothetical protein
MNTLLWTLQGLLAFAFLSAGSIKFLQPKEALEAKMAWTQEFSQGVIRLIGLAELAGAAGVILPMELGIAPRLTHWAAAGLALLMLGAVGTHLKRGERLSGVPALILGLVALFVAVNRWG